MQIDGVWGTICQYLWGFSDAYVACRQLGFSKAVVPDAAPSIPQHGLPILFYTVDCNGSEELIWDCPSSGYGGQHVCSHEDDVRLLCLPNGNDVLVLGEIVLCRRPFIIQVINWKQQSSYKTVYLRRSAVLIMQSTQENYKEMDSVKL